VVRAVGSDAAGRLRRWRWRRLHAGLDGVRDSRTLGHRNPCADSCCDGDAGAQPDADTGSYADADTGSYADADTGSYAYADSYAYTYTYPHAYTENPNESGV
jgi:hypothetical protein